MQRIGMSMYLMLLWHTEQCHTVLLNIFLLFFFSREMRLPVEDDWKPGPNDNRVGEDEYEKHERTLAERLREANKAAGQQSKKSHKTAKWYCHEN